MIFRHWLDKFLGRASRRPTRRHQPSWTRARLSLETLESRTLLSAATQFTVVPLVSPVTAGTPFGVTVTAEDAQGHTVADYLGPVHFSSSDLRATLPADYTFTAADHGVHTFSGVVFDSAAGQTLTAASYRSAP
jgi:hypothetical protein